MKGRQIESVTRMVFADDWTEGQNGMRKQPIWDSIMGGVRDAIKRGILSERFERSLEIMENAKGAEVK